MQETIEERSQREWIASKNNPDNYLTKIYDVVGGTLAETEKAFEKQKSENQIVLIMQDNYCGPEF